MDYVMTAEYANLSDAELLSRYWAGEDSAFREIVDRHKKGYSVVFFNRAFDFTAILSG
jgi:hypothetical protein